MKILITGGCGQIASTAVFELLNSGHQIDVVDNLTTGDYDNLSKFDINIKHVPIFAIDLFEEKYSNLRKQNQVLFFEADFEEEILLKRISCGYYDVILHFAATTKKEDILKNVAVAVDNNITRTFNLLDYSNKSNSTKFILAMHSQDDGSLFVSHKKLIETHVKSREIEVLYLRYDDLSSCESSLKNLLKSIGA
jgi:UDP-glucose 4-epimerase